MDFEDGNRAGSVTALRAGNVALLRPAEQVFDDITGTFPRLTQRRRRVVGRVR